MITACGGDVDQPTQEQRAALRQPLFATEYTIIDRRSGARPDLDPAIEERPDANPQRNAYFGDLHVHTTYSFDAYAFGTLATPYDAYRFAKGEAIKHPAGYDMQLSEPLDFYGVTDQRVSDPMGPLAGSLLGDW
jgi:hypothetical protein